MYNDIYIYIAMYISYVGVYVRECVCVCVYPFNFLHTQGKSAEQATNSQRISLASRHFIAWVLFRRKDWVCLGSAEVSTWRKFLLNSLPVWANGPPRITHAMPSCKRLQQGQRDRQPLLKAHYR